MPGGRGGVAPRTCDIYIYMSQSPLAPLPPPAQTLYPQMDIPPTPHCGLGVGWGSHALLLTFILGLQQNTAFGSTA